MENLEIKDIVDVNNIKKIKAEFNNLINNLEKSKINSIANFNFGGLFLLAQCFLIVPGLISFFWEIKYLGIYLLIPISLLLLTYFFMLKIAIKFNSSLKNIKFKYIYESVKNKKLSINSVNKINEFFDSLNEKNQNILNEILYNDLIEHNESNIAYSLLLKKINELTVSERVDVINNKLKKSENINVEQNKNVIKSI